MTTPSSSKMRPWLSILIAFSSFLLFVGASHAAQDAENQLEMTFEFGTDDEWEEFGSFLNPANIADKTQSAPFVSNHHSIPLTGNADGVGPKVHESGHIQRSLEALFSDESSKIIRSFETVISSTIALGRAFHDVLESVSSDNIPSNDAPLTPLLKKIATFVAIARDDIREKFPLPATAPGHVERVKHVSEGLEHLQQLVVRLARSHEIEQEVIEHHLARAQPFLHEIGVLIGDMAELYPGAIEALVLNVSAVLLPEAGFLRSLVILYCLGPYVLGKDAISGWLLKHVSDALRV